MRRAACASAGARDRRPGMGQGDRVVNGANAGRGAGQRPTDNPRPADLRDEEDQAEANGTDQAE